MRTTKRDQELVYVNTIGRSVLHVLRDLVCFLPASSSLFFYRCVQCHGHFWNSRGKPNGLKFTAEFRDDSLCCLAVKVLILVFLHMFVGCCVLPKEREALLKVISKANAGCGDMDEIINSSGFRSAVVQGTRNWLERNPYESC